MPIRSNARSVPECQPMRPRRLRRPGAPCAGVPPSERWKGQKQVSYLGSDKRRHGFVMTSVSRWCARTTGSEAVRLLPFCQHARLLPTRTRQRSCSSLLIACAFRVAPQPRPGTCVITTSLRNACATGITRDRAGAGPHLGLHLADHKVVRGGSRGAGPRRPRTRRLLRRACQSTVQRARGPYRRLSGTNF